jgi:TRAP-type mannitol/chloroaromatic compound transport system permease small subunit
LVAPSLVFASEPINSCFFGTAVQKRHRFLVRKKLPDTPKARSFADLLWRSRHGTTARYLSVDRSLEAGGIGGNNVTIFLRGLDRLIGHVVAAAKWLALPLVVLLFLQWPLRDVLHGYSREANDLGQVAFALFVAVSVTAATRAGSHLAADLVAQRYSERTRRRLNQIGSAVGLLPWALFILVASRTTVVSSVHDLESFQDSGNPGYFLIKLALWVMAALILGQSLVDIFRPLAADDR